MNFIIIISQITIEILFITVSLFLLKFIRFYIYKVIPLQKDKIFQLLSNILVS